MTDSHQIMRENSGSTSFGLFTLLLEATNQIKHLYPLEEVRVAIVVMANETGQTLTGSALTTYLLREYGEEKGVAHRLSEIIAVDAEKNELDLVAV